MSSSADIAAALAATSDDEPRAYYASLSAYEKVDVKLTGHSAR